MKKLWIVAVAVAACGGTKPIADINPLSDVSGRWQLNTEQSDNAADKIAAALPAGARGTGVDSASGRRRMGGATGRWGGGGGRGRGGRGGMSGGGEGMARIDAQERARRRERAELTVFLAEYGSDDLDVHVTPGAVRLITHGMLDTLALKTNGAKEKAKIAQSDDEVQITTTATWKDGWLVVSHEVDGGGKVTETYLRAADGQHLHVVVQLELPRPGGSEDEIKPRTIEFQRVYDPVAGS
ncbi:MAG TPA: hypothetical protein VH439_05590 [Gemmatimonadales bacterium]